MAKSQVSKSVNAKTVKGTKPQVKKASSAVRFMLVAAARPGSGRALASYTAAWLALSGMDDGKAVPAKMVRALAGDTAYGYHTRAGNFEATADGVRLTESGEFHFSNLSTNRNIRAEPELVKAYADVLSTGKANDTVKNPALIKPMA